MGHCGGGAGPNTFDAVAALDQWVEHGAAPEKIIAAHIVNGVTDRTRPLCPYPQIAKWKGTGSIDEAANFVCADPSALRGPIILHPTRFVPEGAEKPQNATIDQ